MQHVQDARMSLTREQILNLAGAAMADPRTVQRVYQGEKTQALVRERIEAAAKKLKFPKPPVVK